MVAILNLRSLSSLYTVFYCYNTDLERNKKRTKQDAGSVYYTDQMFAEFMDEKGHKGLLYFIERCSLFYFHCFFYFMNA
jgi:hypothetical protein